MVEAKSIAFRELTGSNQLTIPFYQRSYVWTEENWNRLWEDLPAPNCFLGSIILQVDNSNGTTTFKVIDGQQRLTTLTILLRAYYDEEMDDNPNFANSYHDYFFLPRTRNQENDIPLLFNSKIDGEEYNKVIGGTYSDSYREHTNHKNLLIRCYCYFRNLIHSTKLNDCRTYDEISHRLTDTNNRILVRIFIDENDDPQLIFDAINSTGVRLTRSEEIKNTLFGQLSRYNHNNPNESYQLYQKTWFKVFESNEEQIHYWNMVVGTGQHATSYIDSFLRDFAIINGIMGSDAKITELHQCYKNYLQDPDKGWDENSIIAFIETICDYAQKYKETFIDFDVSAPIEYSDYTGRLIHILKTLNVASFNAFILQVLMKQPQAKQKELFQKLETFVIRNSVSGSETSKNFSRALREIIQNGEWDDTKYQADFNDTA